MNTPQSFAYLLIALNLVSLLMFGFDKMFAKSGKRRISEKALLISAGLAATPGALIGMVLFNHKTSKPKFRYGVPALLLIHAAAAYWLAYL